jgi:hypothetical protein
LQAGALERDAEVPRSALAEARLRAAGIELQSNAERAETANYVEQLKARFESACAITDDDLRGMRVRSGEAPDGAAKGAAPAADGLMRPVEVPRVSKGDDPKARLAETRDALKEANSRLEGSRAWYEGVRQSYGQGAP